MKTPSETDDKLVDQINNQAPVKLKTKLAWQCRRGMLELDVILIPFLEQHFELLDDAQQALFVDLLNEADPDLYSWFMGYAKPDRQDYIELIVLIKTKLGINIAIR